MGREGAARAALAAALAALGGAAVLLARRETPGRESLLPLMRFGQEHGLQAERLLAEALPLRAEEERRIGRRVAEGLAPLAVESAELDRVGRRLERTGLARRYGGRYRYRLLGETGDHAFSAPGGAVFVSDGLVRRLGEDRSRLAFVLAHEIAHAELGHTAGLVRYRAWLERRGLPGGDLAQGLRGLAALAYSEGQELEADALAVELMRRADFRLEAAREALELADPAGSAQPRRAADAMLAEGLTDYWRTHPRTSERLAALRSRTAS